MSSTNQPNPYEFSEADTCREYITPAIRVAGWGSGPFEIVEQRSFTDGRIVLTGRTAKRREGKRADYLLSEFGLTAVNEISPGAADRNRTTKQLALQAIQVPVPPMTIRKRFMELKQAMEQVAELRTNQVVSVKAVLPALCNQMLS